MSLALGESQIIKIHGELAQWGAVWIPSLLPPCPSHLQWALWPVTKGVVAGAKCLVGCSCGIGKLGLGGSEGRTLGAGCCHILWGP